MTPDTFWSLIGRIDTALLNRGDEDGALAPLIAALTQGEPAEIFSFNDHLSLALFAIDGKAYAEATDGAGDSGDSFLYCRCHVLGLGKKHYEAVKLDPNLMPKSTDNWCEGLLYVCPNAWAERTDSDPADYPHMSSVSYESGSNTALW